MPDANSNISKWVPAVLVAALLIVSAYFYWRIQGVAGEVASLQSALQKESEARHSDNLTAQETASKQMESMREELKRATEETAEAARAASGEAKRQASQVAKRLNEQAKAHDQVASELTMVKESARAANERIASVSNDVSGVKTDVTNVKSEVTSARTDLEKTVSDLKRVTGDMGVMSGLIATNTKELAALKALGDRNYLSFDFTKSKEPQRLGNVQIVVRKTDPKRHRYSIDVIADDVRIEKKDKTINEPVQFYVTSKSRQPYEVVVNEVQPNRIVGYMATPKVPETRN